jgi:hypothetical protein
VRHSARAIRWRLPTPRCRRAWAFRGLGTARSTADGSVILARRESRHAARVRALTFPVAKRLPSMATAVAHSWPGTGAKSHILRGLLTKCNQRRPRTGGFESRWGYLFRPYTIRVFTTLRGSVQQIFNSGALSFLADQPVEGACRLRIPVRIDVQIAARRDSDRRMAEPTSSGTPAFAQRLAWVSRKP